MSTIGAFNAAATCRNKRQVNNERIVERSVGNAALLTVPG